MLRNINRTSMSRQDRPNSQVNLGKPLDQQPSLNHLPTQNLGSMATVEFDNQTDTTSPTQIKRLDTNKTEM